MERGFKISDGPYIHSVDLRDNTCNCKSWMLKGIPCPHGIAAILYKKLDPIDFVDNCYSKATYLKTYCHYIQLVTNMNMWPKSTNSNVEPPVIVPMPGRPKKRRNKQFYETKKCGKMSRKGIYMTCSIFHGQNHNKRGCPFKNSVRSSILNVGPSDVPST
ncbi:uncharacterized protein LOC107852195 [Capsicum annuum]|uniref:uncharacterized protein LOC107852195 n=1 Tax=Capsicum annuum TaxID=4072 RepID=UPI001FB1832F|nr:uncharacterized protein LOC107852195 [Capsicum annuum]